MRKLWMVFAVVSLAASAVPSAVSASEAKCEEPKASYHYTETEMVYELAVDLAGCDWWSGTSMAVDGFLVREYPRELTVTAIGLQGTEAIRFAICEDPVRVTSCSVSIRLSHPPEELMAYRGEIRYPWKGEHQARHLDVTCVSAGDLADCLPGLTAGAE